MNLVKQPPGSRLCGQCCVAMLGRLPIEQAIKICGHSGKTTYPELRAALLSVGIHCDAILQTPRELPTTAIVAMSFIHWAVWHRGLFYDPAQDKPIAVPSQKITGIADCFGPVELVRNTIARRASGADIQDVVIR